MENRGAPRGERERTCSRGKEMCDAEERADSASVAVERGGRQCTCSRSCLLKEREGHDAEGERASAPVAGVVSYGKQRCITKRKRELAVHL